MKENIPKMLPDIVRTVIMDAPIEKVWKAVSTSESLASWLMPNDFKLEMGCEFTFHSEPRNGWNGVVHCKVTEILPPKRLAFTWCGNNMEQYVSFELKELDGNKTEFTLVHAGWREENLMIRNFMYDGWGHITEEFSKRMGEKNAGYLS